MHREEVGVRLADMNNVGRTIMAIVAGLIIGAAVNLVLVNLGPVVVPLPEGADTSTMESLKESMKLFQPQNFLFPFLGHAVGTLAGAFVAAKLAGGRAMLLALGIGGFFLLGGIAMVLAVGGPLWFVLVDLILAYLPMGYLGGLLGRRGKR